MELTTLNNVLSEGFLPPLRFELEDEDITHTCGAPFDLNLQGEGVQYSSNLDAFEVILVATCSDREHCQHRTTTHVYSRFQISASMLHQFQGQTISMLKTHMDQAWFTMKEMLRDLSGRLNTEDGASAAEKLTKLLAKGHLVLSEAKSILEYEMMQPIQEDHLLKLAERMEFIREDRWRVPEVTVFNYTAMPLTMMPTQYKLDVLLGLPDDHPLAIAA